MNIKALELTGVARLVFADIKLLQRPRQESWVVRRRLTSRLFERERLTCWLDFSGPPIQTPGCTLYVACACEWTHWPSITP
jgi:hypothetical protein